MTLQVAGSALSFLTGVRRRVDVYAQSPGLLVVEGEGPEDHPHKDEFDLGIPPPTKSWSQTEEINRSLPRIAPLFSRSPSLRLAYSCPRESRGSLSRTSTGRNVERALHIRAKRIVQERL